MTTGSTAVKQEHLTGSKTGRSKYQVLKLLRRDRVWQLPAHKGPRFILSTMLSASCFAPRAQRGFAASCEGLSPHAPSTAPDAQLSARWVTRHLQTQTWVQSHPRKQIIKYTPLLPQPREHHLFPFTHTIAFKIRLDGLIQFLALAVETCAQLLGVSKTAAHGDNYQYRNRMYSGVWF